MPSSAVVQPITPEPTRRRAKPSPAERARRALLRQEAKRERLMRAVERRADEIGELRALMESEGDLVPGGFMNTFTIWEGRALDAINAERVPSRRCATLPGWAYEQKFCTQYAGCDLV